MKRKALALALFGAVVAALAAAAPPAAEGPGVAAKPGASNLVFCHWWKSASENAAVKALIDVYKKKYPGVNVSTVASEGSGTKMFSALRNHTRAGQMPDAFQMFAGAPLRPFRDASLINPLDEVWASEGLEKVIPEIVQRINKLDGHYYAVPIDVHRNNVVWYNKALLEKHGIDPATLTSWDAFFKAADTLRGAGVKNPIQLGVMWTATHVLECIMASLGIPAYEDWINGRMTNPEDPRLLEAFTIFKRYFDYANEDHADAAWTLALQRVAKGEAAFCIMGDWANGEFILAGAKYGKDYGTFPVPGTKGMYGLTIDGFLEAHGSPNTVNADHWMRVIVSREGQDAFNSVKGSIPARTDADVTKYDAYQRSAIADFKSAKNLYPSVGAVAPEAFVVKIDQIAASFGANHDVKGAAASMAESAVRLAPKFKEPWKLT
jgi:glucose/mannose transport system substrate-binding protein